MLGCSFLRFNWASGLPCKDRHWKYTKRKSKICSIIIICLWKSLETAILYEHSLSYWTICIGNCQNQPAPSESIKWLFEHEESVQGPPSPIDWRCRAHIRPAISNDSNSIPHLMMSWFQSIQSTAKKLQIKIIICHLMTLSTINVTMTKTSPSLEVNLQSEPSKRYWSFWPVVFLSVYGYTHTLTWADICQFWYTRHY